MDRISAPTAPLRIGRTWLFADGTRLPVISGGADDDGGDDAPAVELPEGWKDLDDDALTALKDQLVAQFDAAYDDSSVNPDALEQLAEALGTVKAEIVGRDEQATADQAKRDALREQVHADDSDDSNADQGDDPADGDDGDGDDGDGGDGGGDGEGDGAGDAGADDKQPAAVTAAAKAKRPALDKVAARAPKPKVGVGGGKAPTIITAAAGLPDHDGGNPMTKLELAKAMHQKARGAGTAKQHVATIHRTGMKVLPRQTDPGLAEDDWQALVAGAMQGKGANQAASLVASGGWCAPSVPLRQFFNLGDAEDLIDLPGVSDGGSGAGVLIPDFYDYTDAVGALWTWTEAMDQGAATTDAVSNKALTSNVATITTGADHGLVVGQTVRIDGMGVPFDGTYVVASTPSATTFTYARTATNVSSAAATGTVQSVKGRLKIPCPTWTEYRLEAEGLWVTHGNLSDRAFPELTRHFMDKVMLAHEHRMSASKIGKIVADATSVTVNAAVLSSDAYGDLMNALELQAMDLRSEYRAGRNTPVDVLLPNFTVGMLRASLAARAGVDMLNVPDATILAGFTNRSIRPQFLSDYEALYSSAPRTNWPDNITPVMFYSGAYGEITGGSIDLTVARDTQLNETNDHTVAFTEEFFQVVRRGPKARKFTLALEPDGVTACCPDLDT